ncbi:peptidoglycan-binding domain-containing protein [Oceanobacillus caeni]|uniref:peptidoglycan-binding domain-containing protein n=1 Tax=Oceanobacillus caeni TaxID=405946 RepID=UPI001956C6D0
MPYNIQKKIIPGLNQRSLIAPNFIVAHDSGNPSNVTPGSLEREVNFMTRNWKNAFVSHWVGGGGRIVQVAEVGRLQYGAGPKANPYAYAQVELARTNNIETFKKDYAAYVWLLRKLANDAGIPIKLDTGSRVTDKGIKTHDWIRRNIGGTVHSDPYAYLASFGISRAQFKMDVEKGTAAVKPTGQSNAKSQTVTAPAPKTKANAKSQPATAPAPKAKANLTVDGKWGPSTTRALQKALGTVVDGVISKQLRNSVTNALYDGVTFGSGGSLVIKALQKKIGANADGYLGPETIRKLQRYLGTPVDGALSRPSSLVVKELQRRLNKGTF